MSSVKCANDLTRSRDPPEHVEGGGRKREVPWIEIHDSFVPNARREPCTSDMRYFFVAHTDVASVEQYDPVSHTISAVPMMKLVPFVTLMESRTLAKLHGAANSSTMSKKSVADYFLDHKCVICSKGALLKGNIPKHSLAAGLWLGDVPPVLQKLGYVEKLLVARVRHTAVFARIATGGRKMKANAMAFEAPIPKVYNILPPPKADIDEILAILFTGPLKPTIDDYKRTPFLVRRNVVKEALDWLIMNHLDYSDVKLSYDNLAEYDETCPPCAVIWREAETNKTVESEAVNDNCSEEGTEEGSYVRTHVERIKLICQNPVASARFFNYIVTIFIEDILGCGSTHQGLYGNHDAHYGVVEQQGRLTLHLHILLWIKGFLSPKEIRERLLAGSEVFEQKLIAYLDSVFAGQFMNGSYDKVSKISDNMKSNETYKDPTDYLPTAPPAKCGTHSPHTS
ncbi:hypothetical protein VNI00_012690 [Paramarasmius palmivorus]|uniref:Helitron helicase-like domain-containing protein n=1 Tax=Paramarasmius palmivorus TaxID=297713 RepID=A0AAW0C2H2_9AGAR